MQINLHNYVVRGSDGSVDTDATLAKFESTLSAYIVERETEQSTIAAAVGAVFDAHKGTAINMPALTSLTVQRLNAQPENFKTLSERVQSYVREQSKGDSSMFLIAKGKGGGVSRRCDIPAKA